MGGSFWIAPFALATQTSFPNSRLNDGPYGAVLARLTGEDWTPKPQSNATFTIDALRAQVAGPDVRDEFLDAIDMMPEGTDVCVVDLRPAILTTWVSPIYPRAFADVAEVLNEKLAGDPPDARFSHTHVLVVVAELSDESDFPFRRLAELSETGRVTVIDPQGSVLSTRFESGDPAEVRGEFERRSPTPQAALKQKMIRRLGYFPRLRELDGYTRYFFDGQYCTDELTALFAEQLRTIVSDPTAAAVVYDPGVAEWVGAPLVAATGLLRAEGFELPAKAGHELERDESGRSLRSVVVLVPVFDRGDTLTSLFRRARKWAPAANIVGLCVVATGDPPKPATFRRRIDDQQVDVHYLMTARQIAVRPDAFSPDVAYYESAPDHHERFLAFTAGDFWELCSEVGFIPERDPPEDRRPLRRVPDLLKFVDKNGPWIAHKIARAIELKAERDPLDVSLALVEGEAGSTRVGEVLASTIANSPLRVPRAVLDDWDPDQGSGTDPFERWRDADWLRAVDAARNRDVVIIDEFAYSGKTLAKMATLFSRRGFDVRLVLALAAFSRRSFDDALAGYTALALYTTEWREMPVLERVEDG